MTRQGPHGHRSVTDLGAGAPADLVAVHVSRLADGLQRELRDHGSAAVDIDGDVNADIWRRAARLAGRRLSERVRTGITGAQAWAVLVDRRPGGEDKRRALDSIEAFLGGVLNGSSDRRSTRS